MVPLLGVGSAWTPEVVGRRQVDDQVDGHGVSPVALAVLGVDEHRVLALGQRLDHGRGDRRVDAGDRAVRVDVHRLSGAVWPGRVHEVLRGLDVAVARCRVVGRRTDVDGVVTVGDARRQRRRQCRRPAGVGSGDQNGAERPPVAVGVLAADVERMLAGADRHRGVRLLAGRVEGAVVGHQGSTRAGGGDGVHVVLDGRHVGVTAASVVGERGQGAAVEENVAQHRAEGVAGCAAALATSIVVNMPPGMPVLLLCSRPAGVVDRQLLTAGQRRRGDDRVGGLAGPDRLGGVVLGVVERAAVEGRPRSARRPARPSSGTSCPR